MPTSIGFSLSRVCVSIACARWFSLLYSGGVIFSLSFLFVAYRRTRMHPLTRLSFSLLASGKSHNYRKRIFDTCSTLRRIRRTNIRGGDTSNGGVFTLLNASLQSDSAESFLRFLPSISFVWNTSSRMNNLCVPLIQNVSLFLN